MFKLNNQVGNSSLLKLYLLYIYKIIQQEEGVLVKISVGPKTCLCMLPCDFRFYVDQALV